jgi:hypothetical protein
MRLALLEEAISASRTPTESCSELDYSFQLASLLEELHSGRYQVQSSTSRRDDDGDFQQFVLVADAPGVVGVVVYTDGNGRCARYAISLAVE